MKKFLLMMALFFAAISMNAQTAIELPKFTDNIYVGAGGAASTPLNFKTGFPLNSSAGIVLGKMFTPVFGAELEGDAIFGSRTSDNLRFDPNAAGSHNIVRASYAGINTVTNLSNLFGGYLGFPRKFEVDLVAGAGWQHTFTAYQTDRDHNAFMSKTGFNLNYNISDASVIRLQPAVVWNLSQPGNSTGALAFNQKGAQAQLGLAYIYKFKNSNGTHNFKQYDVGAMEAELARLNTALAEKPKEVVKTNYREVTKIVTVTDVYVFFEFDSYELDDRAKAELDKVGQDGIYDIDGYASAEGSKEYNLELSQRRAEAVKKYLEARGCKINKAIGRGVEFGPTTGRVAIIKGVKIPAQPQQNGGQRPRMRRPQNQ